MTESFSRAFLTGNCGVSPGVITEVLDKMYLQLS
jgi:hypothetical protein